MPIGTKRTQNLPGISAPPFDYSALTGQCDRSTIDLSSFSGLLTRVEIGHIRIGSAGNCRIKSRGSGSSPSQRT